MSTTITPTEQTIDINVTEDVIDINVTNNIVDVNATTEQINIEVAGAYPLPASVYSVFGRVGDVIATNGDYNTSLVTENTNLYFTNARARGAISLTTSGTSGAATYDSGTGVLNVPQYQGGVTSFNTRTGAISLTSADVSGALTYVPYNSSNPSGYLSSVSLTTNVTGTLPIANGGTGATTASAARTSLGLAIGTDVLAYRTFGTAANNNTGDFYLSTNPSGFISGITSGMVTTALGYTPVTNARTLTINGTTYDLTADRSWTIATSSGTVTSVGFSAPTGFNVTGSPITTSGTLALGFASGYSLPTNVKQSNWDDAYTFVAAFPTQTGNAGKYLTTDGSVLSWATNPLGTVTSVAMTVPTGLSVSGSPITSSGTLTVTFASGYSIPTNASQTDWDTAYTNRITSLTTTGASGSATLISNTLNIPTYTLVGLGGQPALSGTGFVKISGTTISYDNSTYYLASNPSAFIALTALSAGTGISYNNTTGVITNSAPDQTVILTSGTGISVSGTYPSFTIASTITQYTDALARASISLTTTGTSGAATYDNTTGVLNIPQYSGGGGGGMAIGGSITSATAGSVLFVGASGVLAQDNTGLFFDVTNDRLGIGTATPATDLHISKAYVSAQTEFRVENTSTSGFGTRFSLYSSASSTAERNWSFIQSAWSFGDFSINQSNAQGGNPYTAGTLRLYLSPSGNLGLGGTSTVGSTLQINGNSAIGYSASTAAPTNGLAVSGNTTIGTTTASAKLTVIGSNTVGASVPTNFAAIVAGRFAVVNGNNTFYFDINSGPYAELSTYTYGVNTPFPFVVQANGGNFGIGTLNVGSRLQVNGNAAIGYSASTAAPTNGLAVSGNSGFGTTSPGYTATSRQVVAINGGSGGAQGSILAFMQAGVNKGYVFSILNDMEFWCESGAITIGNNAAANITFKTNNTERLRIESGGNLGLGTTTIGSKLQVNGNAAIGYSASTAAPTNGLVVAGLVGVGVSSAASTLQVNQVASTTKGIFITGDEIFATGNGSTSTGVRIALGVSRTGNRQLWIGDNAAFGSTTVGIFRYLTGYTGYASLDAVSGDGNNRLLTILGTSTSNVGIGNDSGGDANTALYTAKLSTFVFNENRNNLLLRKTGTGTGDFINAVDNGGTTKFVVNVGGSVGINTTTIGSSLQINGNAAIGYSASTAAPTNGMSVSGTVNVGTNTSVTTAALQVSSTTQGFLPPVMTTTQKNAIATPAAGLIVYDTTLNKLCVFTTAWETITSL